MFYTIHRTSPVYGYVACIEADSPSEALQLNMAETPLYNDGDVVVVVPRGDTARYLNGNILVAMITTPPKPSLTFEPIN